MTGSTRGLTTRLIVELAMAELRIVERLDAETTDRLFEEALIHDVNSAWEEFTPPHVPEAVTDPAIQGYHSTTEMVRLARMSNLVQSGDRVVDIGVSRGYVLAALYRNSNPSFVAGIDINPRHFETAQLLCTENGASNNLVFEVADVLNIERAFLDRHRPDIILMFEVLEHVKDPERALQALSSAMRPDDLLVFSVPIQGRIEACWGHHHAFDSSAVVELVERSGLHVVWVEVLHNQWAIFGVSHNAQFSEHERFMKPAVTSSSKTHLQFSPILSARATTDAGTTTTEQPDAMQVTDGFLELATPRLAALRLDLGFSAPRDIEHVLVTGHHSDGEVACSWTSQTKHRISEKPRNFALRPGWNEGTFTAHIEDLSQDIDFVRISVQSTSRTRITVAKAAFASGPLAELTLPPVNVRYGTNY